MSERETLFEFLRRRRAPQIVTDRATPAQRYLDRHDAAAAHRYAAQRWAMAEAETHIEMGLRCWNGCDPKVCGLIAIRWLRKALRDV